VAATTRRPAGLERPRALDQQTQASCCVRSSTLLRYQHRHRKAIFASDFTPVEPAVSRIRTKVERASGPFRLSFAPVGSLKEGRSAPVGARLRLDWAAKSGVGHRSFDGVSDSDRGPSGGGLGRCAGVFPLGLPGGGALGAGDFGGRLLCPRPLATLPIVPFDPSRFLYFEFYTPTIFPIRL
jgi:hypothetical protein